MGWAKSLNIGTAGEATAERQVLNSSTREARNRLRVKRPNRLKLSGIGGCNRVSLRGVGDQSRRCYSVEKSEMIVTGSFYILPRALRTQAVSGATRTRRQPIGIMGQIPNGTNSVRGMRAEMNSVLYPEAYRGWSALICPFIGWLPMYFGVKVSILCECAFRG